MRKLVFISLLGFFLLSSNAYAQDAIGYDSAIVPQDIVFSYTAPLAGQVTFRSPLHNLDGTDNFALVNSKYDQPRDVSVTGGTNPHIGVDLQALEGTIVYPVRDGKVYKVDPCWGRVTIQFDVNNDGNFDLINDNLFVTYLHMKSISVAAGNNVTVNTPVGQVSNTVCSGTKPPAHLHWEINTITGTSDCKGSLRGPGCTAVRASMYYTGLTGTQWNGGRDLDFISDIAFENARVAAGSIYTMNNGSHVPVNYGDVILFHRQQGAPNWNWSLMNKNVDRFFLDLAPFYPSGTDLELYGRASRSDIDKPLGSCGITPYNYSFMKPKSFHPDPCNPDPDALFHVKLVY